MKFEAWLLKGIFCICLLLCVATVGSMVTTHAPAPAATARAAHMEANAGSVA